MTAIVQHRTRLVNKIKLFFKGEILTDRKNLKKFSRDQSIYEITPLTVVRPHDPQDLQQLVDFCRNEGFHLTPRGGGSGTTGAALGNSIVFTLPSTPIWNDISELTGTNNTIQIHAGAGAYHNELQHALKNHGLYLPADVSSARISQIGGNIATRASGPHALRYGCIDRFLLDLEFISARGELINTADRKTIPDWLRDGILSLQRRIAADKKTTDLLQARSSMKTTSGYNLAAFIREKAVGKLTAQLFAGSNGTLGCITRATFRAEPVPVKKAAMLLHFDTLIEAGRAVCAVKELDVDAIEMVNRETLEILDRKRPAPSGFDRRSHLLLVELAGRDLPERIEKIKMLLKAGRYTTSHTPVVATTDEEMATIWRERKRILPLLHNPGPHLKALAVVNDIGVDPVYLSGFIEELQSIFKRHQLTALIYGHAGSGNLHLRPLFDLNRPNIKDRIQKLADDVYSIVCRYHGTIAGEHGIGRLKAPYLKNEWGESVYGYMHEVKKLFDPEGILNPDVLLSDKPLSMHLRPELTVRQTGEAK